MFCIKNFTSAITDSWQKITIHTLCQHLQDYMMQKYAEHQCCKMGIYLVTRAQLWTTSFSRTPIMNMVTIQQVYLLLFPHLRFMAYIHCIPLIPSFLHNHFQLDFAFDSLLWLLASLISQIQCVTSCRHSSYKWRLYREFMYYASHVISFQNITAVRSCSKEAHAIFLSICTRFKSNKFTCIQQDQ